jgi:hypothetical protein
MSAIVTDTFFDRPAVIKRLRAEERRILSKAGAYVRRSAKQSIKSRGGKRSKPGQAPTNRTGLLRDLIFFSWDPLSRSVIVGPEGRRSRARQPVPQLLEFGGLVRWTRWTSRRDTAADGSEITVRRSETRSDPLEARPYMGPALTKNLRHIPEPWRNAIQ